MEELFDLDNNNNLGYVFTFLEFISSEPNDLRVKTQTRFIRPKDVDIVNKFFKLKSLKSPEGLAYLEPGEFDKFFKKGLNKNIKIINTIKDILHGRIIVRSRENAVREV